MPVSDDDIEFEARWECMMVREEELDLDRYNLLGMMGRTVNGPHRLPDEQPRANWTWIYFIQGKNGGPIKIGQSTDPRARLKQLQTSNPETLVLRRVVNAPEEMEARLHALFRDDQIRGEWFKATPAIAAMANAIPDEEGDVTVIHPGRRTWRPLPGEVRGNLSYRNRGAKEPDPDDPDRGYYKPQVNRFDKSTRAARKRWREDEAA